MSEQKAVTVTQDLNNTLMAMVPQLQRALPKHIKPEYFARTIQTQIQKNPNLMKAIQSNKIAFLAAIQTAAECGLVPDGKEAALIPYGSHVEFQPMVKGVKQLCHNSGVIKAIKQEIVHENDIFKEGVFNNVPYLNWERATGDRGEAIGAFAIITTTNGGAYSEYMTKVEIEDVRDKYSKGKDSSNGGWKKAAFEMWKKTVFHRLAKTAPTSREIRIAFGGSDIEKDMPIEVEKVTDAESLPPKATSSRLKEAMDQSQTDTDEI